MVGRPGGVDVISCMISSSLLLLTDLISGHINMLRTGTMDEEMRTEKKKVTEIFEEKGKELNSFNELMFVESVSER